MNTDTIHWIRPSFVGFIQVISNSLLLIGVKVFHDL